MVFSDKAHLHNSVYSTVDLDSFDSMTFKLNYYVLIYGALDIFESV